MADAGCRLPPPTHGHLGSNSRATAGRSRTSCYSASVARKTLVIAALVASFGAGLGLACDRKWDFECTAVWEKRSGEELSRETYTYTQMDSENAATARCKQEMLDARPKGGKSATCHCVGTE